MSISIIFSLVIASDASANTLFATINKSEIKQGESVLLNFKLINNKSRRIPFQGIDELKEFYGNSEQEALSLCNQDNGSDLVGQISGTQGSFLLNNPGYVYIKPYINGAVSSCIGPVRVLSTSAAFEQIALENNGKFGEYYKIGISLKDSLGNLAAAFDEKVFVSINQPGEGCSGRRISKTRLMQLKTKNGAASVRIRSPQNVQSFYVKVRSGDKISCIVISKDPLDYPYGPENKVSAGGQYHKATNGSFSIISNVGSPSAIEKFFGPNFILQTN